MENLSLLEVILIVADLLSLSMAGGLVFTVIVQPSRSRNTWLFVVFSVSMGIWALTALFLSLPVDWMQIQSMFALQIRSTAMGLMVLSYYMFVMAFINPPGRVVRIATMAAPVAFVISLVVIWTGGVLQDPEVFVNTGLLELTLAGYFIIGGTVGYLCLTFWFILSSGEEHSRLLRVPTLLLIAAYAINAFESFFINSFDTILITAAAIWIGWAVLRHQVFNPLNELNAELRVANNDLQQVVNDLARERDRAENLNEDLRAANRYKSEFLANMSHELRTPLNSIMGYSELLRQRLYGDLNEKQEDRLEKIYRNGSHLLHLISDILDLNKIDEGTLKLETATFEVGSVLTEAIDAVQSTCDAKGIALKTEIQPDLPALFADRGRVRQIMGNLLDNAVKFTREGSVTIEAQRVQINQGQSPDFKLPAIGWLRDGLWIIICVIDTGIGIAPEDQARIFEEFSQVDTSHTREFGGTGLGLAITKKLVSMHAGQIWVSSRMDEGSTFFVALPADVVKTPSPTGEIASSG